MRITFSPDRRGLLLGALLPLCLRLESTSNQGVATARAQAVEPERAASPTRAGQASKVSKDIQRVNACAPIKR